jgi:hypothetical protein
MAPDQVIANWQPRAIATCAMQDRNPAEFVTLASKIAGAFLILSGATRDEGRQFAALLEVQAGISLEHLRARLN